MWDIQRALSEALDRETATSEILRVISQSPTDVQPVFDTIARSALRLLGGVAANVARLIGEELHLAALTTTSEAGDDAVKAASRFTSSIARQTPNSARRGRAWPKRGVSAASWLCQ